MSRGAQPPGASAGRVLRAAIAAALVLAGAAAARAGPGRCGPLSAERTAAALEELVAAVRGALPDGSEASVTDVTLRGCERLPRRFARLEVVPAVGARPGVQASATLRLLDDRGRPLAQAWLTAVLDVRVRAVVAGRTLPAGTILRPGDVTWGLVERGRLARSVASPEAALGLRLRRALPAGEPLAETAIERPLLVRRGELVIAVVSRGDLVVTGRGIAAEDGRLGETIRLTSPDGARAFVGRVSAPDEVEVR